MTHSFVLGIQDCHQGNCNSEVCNADWPLKRTLWQFVAAESDPHDGLRHRPRSCPFSVATAIVSKLTSIFLTAVVFDNFPISLTPSFVMSFSEIPILDLSLACDAATKPAFLDSLRNALLDVGFLYIKNTGIEDSLIKEVVEQGKAFFDLPEEQKLEVQMKNQPSFLGIFSTVTSCVMSHS